MNVKFDVIISILLLVSLPIGYLYLTSNDATTGIGYKNRERLKTMDLLFRYNGTYFPNITYREVSSDTAYRLPHGEEYIIVLALGRSGCSPCQIRELRNLDTLYSELDKEIPIAAVYYNGAASSSEDSRVDAMRIARVGNVDYPFLYTMSPEFGRYMSRGRFPMIFLIHGRMVVSTFAAVPADDAFSRIYMGYLRRVAGGLLPKPSLPNDLNSQKLTYIPSQWAFQKVESGEEYTLDSFRGKSIFLNFWATWCRPCRMEMESIQQLYENTSRDSIVVIALSGEPRDTVRKFMAKYKFSFPVFVYRGSRPDIFRSDGIPVTFLISSRGTIVYEHSGAANWYTSEVLTFLKRIYAL